MAPSLLASRVPISYMCLVDMLLVYALCLESSGPLTGVSVPTPLVHIYQCIVCSINIKFMDFFVLCLNILRHMIFMDFTGISVAILNANTPFKHLYLYIEHGV